MQTVRKYLVWAVFCCFVLGVRSAGAKIFDMEEFRLDNGLQVIVIPNRKAPIVRQMIWYKVGSVDEALGKGGTAHLLEHLMFRGTKKVKNSDFNAIIARNGGESNAFTAQDFTAYYETTDVSRLELAMALEADRMENLDFGKKAFDKERDVVFQERMQVVENNPSSYFGESLRRVLWQQHPYSRPISGSPEEIKSVSRADVMDFYRRYYAPNNAILLLSGDIEPKTAKLLAEKGCHVEAVSDVSGGLYRAGGLDIPVLFDFLAKNPGKMLKDYEAEGVSHISNREVLTADVDILIPAAMENQITAEIAKDLRAKVIVEAANGPTTVEADEILGKREVLVIPDVLANAGGVIVSYFEWVQNIQSLTWEESEVNENLAKIITRAFDDVWNLAEQKKVTPRMAAYMTALRRLVVAKQFRPIFP